MQKCADLVLTVSGFESTVNDDARISFAVTITGEGNEASKANSEAGVDTGTRLCLMEQMADFEELLGDRICCCFKTPSDDKTVSLSARFV